MNTPPIPSAVAPANHQEVMHIQEQLVFRAEQMAERAREVVQFNPKQALILSSHAASLMSLCARWMTHYAYYLHQRLEQRETLGTIRLMNGMLPEIQAAINKPL